jgi:elongation factor P--(R)-beta-lysine ligase
VTWWTPQTYADRRPALIARNRIKAALRRWFERQGFVEVEPACLQVSPGNETHIHAFATDLETEAGAKRRLYLHTSPEFACKKLLAAGEPKLFTFSPVFRNREQAAALHAAEFTMLEWYEAGADYRTTMDQCAIMLSLAARAVGRRRWSYRDRVMSAGSLAQYLTVTEAFTRLAGIDLMATISAKGSTDRDALAAQARAKDIRVGAEDTWSDLFSRVMVERIEPRLGQGAATILYEYPVAEAALARPCAHDQRLAERFELYACGVELANGFGELTDPEEQRRRFETAMAEKQHLYGQRYPIDEDFLDALAIMPASSGVAMGFDRLVMLAVGAPRIDDVIWTPMGGAR